MRLTCLAHDNFGQDCWFVFRGERRVGGSLCKVNAEVESRFSDDQNHKHGEVVAERECEECAKQYRNMQDDNAAVWLKHKNRHGGAPKFPMPEKIDDERP